MALAARSIRIEAPIPGRDVVGIEIPNHVSEIVGFRRAARGRRHGRRGQQADLRARPRRVAARRYAVDLARMPHLLIAGATGSGKSVCVNALITSLLMRATPDEVRLILVDLKRVELAAYRDLPHLLTCRSSSRRTRRAPCWPGLVHEMEERYETLADATRAQHRRLQRQRRGVDAAEPMPYIVVVIDELADLMLREGRKVEEPVVKLAQKARAVGIHLVLATQRPSVNVVTGLIKANVPSRIAFAMASNVDSRTVLDAARRGGPHRPRRHALPARRPAAPGPPPGRLRQRRRGPRGHRLLARAGPSPTYNRDLLAGADDDDGGEGGQFGWLAKIGRGRADAARGRAGHADRQGEHVDAADQAQGRLQPRDAGSWTSSRSTASSGRWIRATRPRRGRSTAPTTGCAAPRTWTSD